MSLDRRSFLASFGGFAAAAFLPSLAGDDPSLFPARGGAERLILAYQHVHIGLPKPFSVLHISDTHITEAYPHEKEKLAFNEQRRRTFGGRQQEALRDSLAWAKANVDYLVHTGDLIDFQTEANFDIVRSFYGETAVRFGSTGNHEYQRRIREEGIRPTAEYNGLSAETFAKVYPFDTTFRSVVAGGVNFIAIEQVYGVVSAAQVERFHAEVKKGLPIVLCMHVPFYTDFILRASAKFWRYRGKKLSEMPTQLEIRGDNKRQTEDPVTRDFIAYLKGEPLLKAILAGHLHLAVQDRFSPTAMEYVVGGNFMFHGQEIFFT